MNGMLSWWDEESLARWLCYLVKQRHQDGECTEDDPFYAMLEENSLIYLIGSEVGRPVKIGHSASLSTLSARLKNLQSANSEKLRVICAIPGTIQQERELHKTLAEHNVNGEWFEDNISVALEYARLCAEKRVSLQYGSPFYCGTGRYFVCNGKRIKFGGPDEVTP